MHGGRRQGAGRKSKTGLRSHRRREVLRREFPIHVGIKIRKGLPNIRSKEIYKIWREAVRTARKKGFGVAHFSLLRNHAHFIIEPNEPSLRAQMQSLCVSFAKRLNKKLKREGAVFHDRYFVSILKSPLEVKRALRYVLTNEPRHRARPAPWWNFPIKLDPFSSALHFKKWSRLCERRPTFEATLWRADSIAVRLDEILQPIRTKLLKSWA